MQPNTTASAAAVDRPRFLMLFPYCSCIALCTANLLLYCCSASRPHLLLGSRLSVLKVVVSSLYKQNYANNKPAYPASNTQTYPSHLATQRRCSCGVAEDINACWMSKYCHHPAMGCKHHSRLRCTPLLNCLWSRQATLRDTVYYVGLHRHCFQPQR